MDGKIRIGTEELDSEELNRRIPGLSLNVPCSAKRRGDESECSVSTPICHIFDYLSRWNYVLWHVGLQLRELRRPGKLCLVRVVYRCSGGFKQRVRSRDARILFHVLLVQHSCVESLHLDDVLIEGSGLGEYRECVVSALEKNTSLRTLTLGSLFGDYRSIREDLFKAISTMANLRELVVLGCGAAPLALLDAICQLLVDTMCLVTLSMPGIVLDEEGGTCLIYDLVHNTTVENLCVHVSILHSYMPNGLSKFCRFLATSVLLTSLSMQGMRSDSDSTCADLKRIVEALALRGELEQLRLTGFLLNAECAALFAHLVSRNGGRLRSLDISGCRWCIPKSLPEHRRACKATRDEQPDDPGLTKSTCPWIQAFDRTARVELSFLALSFAGLEPDDLQALLNVAVTVESLQIISLRHVSRCNLMQVCRTIRQTGMSRRVRLEDIFLVDRSALAELWEFPEALRKMAISSVDCESPKAFADTVHMACTWYKVSTLKLLLTQEVLSDIPTFNKLSKCLRSAFSLSELALIGSNRPDLDLTLKSADPPHSVLLDVISRNTSLRSLRLSGIRLGNDNLWFVVEEIFASETLSEIYFASWDPTENDDFLHIFGDLFCGNKSVTKLRVRVSTNGVDDERWFFVEDLISRNMGYLTCAVHFLLGDQSSRSEAAFKALCNTPALSIKFAELTNGGLTRRTTRNISG
ncbi:uncharacterized protein LOC119400278 isoform X1 [Rhipicephalus sanguineus]|uniref:Uncharacterized protein n=1 Tax=Rhipicephalus sanguineus TaxID=34632 RepID=A0A9D4PHM4_RHISA|nr:uncharacterized protein LOC119400278 isoform X3 [Rhipicephalus sanguineus]XP_049273975.1 uncharacterized protein LOC119400278 isoform X1 [Rhipicephalus sanguineus]KAH7942858.1 hypothetical protein HPB52_002035 [Rhipicephalus sanguineus]